jgi:hypothetical protein
MMQQNALIQGLLAKGYHITAVIPYASEIVGVGYKDVVVEDGFSKIMKITTESMMYHESRLG